MNYSEMSDFEIDKAVAEIIFPDMKITNFAGEAVVWDEKNNTRVVRYCHSWADAGPIIEASKIKLEFRHDCNDFWLAASSLGEHAFLQKTPLRAAMIVFLMMQESK
jgi:hypothetical protein